MKTQRSTVAAVLTQEDRFCELNSIDDEPHFTNKEVNCYSVVSAPGPLKATKAPPLGKELVGIESQCHMAVVMVSSPVFPEDT